jgi:hypothetical protein
MYPGWMNPDSVLKMDPQNFTDLYYTHESRNSEGFYKAVRKNKGLISGCDSGFDNWQETLETAIFLRKQYGNIFSFRFLQNSNLDINIEDKRMIPMWEEIYDQLIDTWIVYENLDTIISDYRKAEILETTPVI